MNLIIPIVVAILFWLGGRDQMPIKFNQKLFRWIGIGLFLSICSVFYDKGIYSLLCLLTYFLATNVVGYGENHPFRKLFGKDIQWMIYGFCFGLASFFALSWLSIIQSALSAVSCYILLKWSNDGWEYLPYIGDKFPYMVGNKLNHEYAELGIGFIGTLLYIFI